MINNLPYTDQEKELIAVTLLRLADGNPNLPQQLVKLAEVKENKPALWKRALLILKIK